METKEILKRAKATVPVLRSFSAADLDRALRAMADALEAGTDGILEENAADMEAARGHIGDVMLDRLRLTRERVRDMAEGIRVVAALPSPVGRVLERSVRPNGLEIEKVSVPLGVLAIIYESRPNVT
mgnify:FL=1